MVTICIGPVCVPLHLLLPFFVGVLHRWGFFKWFKQEWVTLRFWRHWWAGSSQKTAEVKARPDVTEADKAVKDAMQPDKSANGSAADGHNTNGNFQHKLSAKGGRDSNAQDDQSLQSGLKSPAGLQQRTIGQSSQGPTSPQ